MLKIPERKLVLFSFVSFFVVDLFLVVSGDIYKSVTIPGAILISTFSEISTNNSLLSFTLFIEPIIPPVVIILSPRRRLLIN